MIDTNTLQFKKLDREGLDILVSWAAQEGWDPGINDADVFWATDPDGFYGYFQNGALIAGGSVVSYNGEFGFMGFFIVQPEFRSSGIGRKLWYQRRDTLLARLTPGSAIGMDGVVAMQQFYKKGGFEIAYRDERHEKKGVACAIDSRVSLIDEKDIESVLSYDKLCFGFARPQFMRPWITQPLAKAFKFTENGILKGFTVLRRTGKGYKIGPLFADNAEIAEELYKACLNSAIGESVFIDIPVANNEAVALVKKYDAAYVFECARMYLGNPPKNDLGKVFGVTTFELG